MKGSTSDSLGQFKKKCFSMSGGSVQTLHVEGQLKRTERIAFVGGSFGGRLLDPRQMVFPQNAIFLYASDVMVTGQTVCRVLTYGLRAS